VKIQGDDYRKRGPHSFTVLNGAFQPAASCWAAYTLHEPVGKVGSVLVVLAPGFTRKRQTLRGWGRHLASWGIPAATLDFCDAKPWRNDHRKNGGDMVVLAGHLRYDQAIYAGYSAGGLAAMMAGNLDKRAVAIFGLDPVDWRGRGAKLAAGLTVPTFGLIGEPSPWNARNNATAIYKNAPDSRLLKVQEADHCMFEFPTDPLCNLVRGNKPKQLARFQIKEAILALSTAFLLWQTGLAAEAADWWHASQNNYEYLHKLGIIRSIV
jgi:pimeloyl-ACP methyl ester carboxylesterase